MEFRMDDVRSRPGRIAVVTGANTGIGYETALGLAQTGMNVILACRNLEKAEAAKTRMLGVLSNVKLAVMPLDLSQLSSVKAFAEQYRRHYDQLD